MNNIIIKPADKGGATVIMDTIAYKQEALRQLKNTKYYKEIDQDLIKTNTQYIKEKFKDIKDKKFITNRQFKYLCGLVDPSPRVFYLLPKIHKGKDKWPQPNMPEGRPIVSDCNSESCRAAEYIDHFLNPISNKNFSYTKNTYHFIDKIQNQSIPDGYLLVTGDVKSLYTNMNIHRIIQTVRTTMAENPQNNRPDNEIMDLLEFTLTHNDFTFNNTQYLQIFGTAMGKKYAPALANIYLAEFDNQAVTGYPTKPELYSRFLDDVFFIWGGGVDKLLAFQTFLNNLIPDIEITFEYSATEISFLDTTIYISNNALQTRTFFKPTDTHQLLHTQSYHPKHTFQGILKSQFIRFKRLSSTHKDYNDTCAILRSYLKTRGYTNAKFRHMQHYIWHTHTDRKERNTDDKPIFPIIMPHSTIGQQLIQAYKHILQDNDTIKDYRPVAAYTVGKNLKKRLVKSKFINNTIQNTPQNDKIGMTTCNNMRCILCRNHTTTTNTIQSSTNKRTFTIDEKIYCHSTNIIYAITCTRCNIQYVGETGRSARDRLTDHRSNIKHNKATPIAIHFNSLQHDAADLILTPVQLLVDATKETRLKTEKLWSKRLNTFYPHGLNNLPTTFIQTS